VRLGNRKKQMKRGMYDMHAYNMQASGDGGAG